MITDKSIMPTNPHGYKVNDKIKFCGEKQRYTVQAVSERYIVCTKPLNIHKTVLYCIVDFVKGIRGPNDLVFNCFDFETREGCEAYLTALLLPEGHEDYQNHQISWRRRCSLCIETKA